MGQGGEEVQPFAGQGNPSALGSDAGLLLQRWVTAVSLPRGWTWDLCHSITSRYEGYCCHGGVTLQGEEHEGLVTRLSLLVVGVTTKLSMSLHGGSHGHRRCLP